MRKPNINFFHLLGVCFCGTPKRATHCTFVHIEGVQKEQGETGRELRKSDLQTLVKRGNGGSGGWKVCTLFEDN